MRGNSASVPATAQQVARRRPAGADAGRQPLQVEGIAQAAAQLAAQARARRPARRRRRGAPRSRGGRPAATSSQSLSSRAPIAVTVRSRTASSDPARPPSRRVRVSSRLRRVTSSRKQEAVLGIGPQPVQVAQARFQRLLQVQQQGAGGVEAGLAVVEAEAGQRVDVEVAAQVAAGGGGVEGPVGPGGDGQAGERLAQALARARGLGVGRPSRRRKHLGGGQPADLVDEPVARHVGGLEEPGGQIDPGEADGGRARPAASGRRGGWPARGSSRSSSVSVPGVTTRVTSRRMSRPLAWAASSTWSQMATRWPARSSRRRWTSRAWCGKPAIGIALSRVVSVMPEDARDELGVLVEQFVEVPAAEQQEHARVALLGLPVLLHHRRGHGSSVSFQLSVIRHSFMVRRRNRPN